MLRARMLPASTRAAASPRAVLVDSHYSSAFCSYQPGRGEASGKAARPSATELPLSSQTTALVAVVEQSIPMTKCAGAMLIDTPRHPRTGPSRGYPATSTQHLLSFPIAL